MSNPSGEEFIRAALLFGLPALLQRGHEQEQKRENARNRIREAAKKDELTTRKNILVERVMIAIERLKSANDKEIAQARLNQILHTDLSKVPEYEQLVDSWYPETIARVPVTSYRPISNVVFPLHQTQLPGSIGLSNMLFPIPQPQQRPAPIVKEDEKKINVSKFSELERLADDIKSGNLTCAICLEKFDKNDKDVEIRRCLHAFHKKCLTTWENTGRTNGKVCPTCRQ